MSKCTECNGRGHFLFAMSTPTCDVCGGTGVVGDAESKPNYWINRIRRDDGFEPPKQVSHWMNGKVRMLVMGPTSLKSDHFSPSIITTMTLKNGLFYNPEAISFPKSSVDYLAEDFSLCHHKVLQRGSVLNRSLPSPTEVKAGQTLTFAPGAIQIPESDV